MKRVGSSPIGRSNRRSSRFAGGSPPPVFARRFPRRVFPSSRRSRASLRRTHRARRPAPRPRPRPRPRLDPPSSVRHGSADPPSASARPSSAHRSRAFDVTAPLSQHTATMPAAPDSTGSGEPDLYAALGVSSVASSTEIRRAYRTLITKVRFVTNRRRDPLALHSLHLSRVSSSESFAVRGSRKVETALESARRNETALKNALSKTLSPLH